MKKIFLIINFFLLIFISSIESKEIKVSKINLLDNIEKHISLKEVSNYLFESKYSGKNKKYSTFNIKNSTNFFKNKEYNLVQIVIDNKDNRIHSIGEIGTINSTYNNCSKLIDDIIDEFKSTYKINLNDKSIITTDIEKEVNKENFIFEKYSYYHKKDKYLFIFQCVYLTPQKDSSNNSYSLSLIRVTKEYNDWLVNAKK